MLGHRGPDGYGLYLDDCVGLAHARLSLIDLNGGFQPLHNEDRTIWLAVNGEVFNHIELRRFLEGKGHRFYTRSDSEVIIHAYEAFGDRAWSMFNGQFAFALWDSRRRSLWLVRDRVGIVPLHVAELGSMVLFASEAKALFACDELSPRFDAASLVQTFTRWSTAAPDTMFEGVSMVPPGAAVRYDLDLTKHLDNYWRPDFTVDPALDALSLDQAADALQEHLSRAVELRLRADVPVGAYLSGGLDSSMIASLVHCRGGGDMRTFAVRFADPAYDETAEQQQMVAVLGTDHHDILCTAQTIRDVLPDVVWRCETPLLRTSPAPLYTLSNLVRSLSRKVVLTGEGADEILAGYHIFKEDRIRRFWARRPGSKMRSALLSRLYPYVVGGNDAMWRQFFAKDLEALDDPFYSHRIRWSNTAFSLRFLAPEIRESVTAEALEERLRGELHADFAKWTPLRRAQDIEMRTFLSSYLLSCQGDRVAMANGVEVRYPFLDPDVIDFCARLPDRFKLLGLRDKLVLRRLASRSLPNAIWRRPKRPYRAPTAPAIAGTGGPIDWLLDDEAINRFGLLDPGATRRLVDKARRNSSSSEREGMALVGVATLQLLAQAFGPEFRERAAEAETRLTTLPLHVFEDHRIAEMSALSGEYR